jgi:predicted transposase/invertase (TIGR01784 family)
LTADATKDEKPTSEQTGESSGETYRFDHDGFWKDLIEKFFYSLLKRALPELYEDADKTREPRFLDKEFRDILNTADPKIHTSPHFADYLLEVPLKGGGAEWFMLHFEIQGRGGGSLAERMYYYKSLIYCHYRREPAALVIITDRRPENEPRYYSHSRYGTESNYRYNKLSLMDLDDDELTASDNPADLVLYAAKCSLRSSAELQKYNFLRKTVELLGERGWSKNDKRDLLLFIERILYLKDEKLEAQYIEYRQQLRQEGKIVFIPMGEREVAEQIKRQGREEGRLEGRLEGKLEVARNLLADGVSPDVIVRNTGLPIEKIRELMN